MKRVRKGKVKDTKRYNRRWGIEGIRWREDCPGPTRGCTIQHFTTSVKCMNIGSD